MKRWLIASGLLLALAASGARAETEHYPWCALYTAGEDGGGTNCGFSTYAQCMATVTGMGGMCQPNTQYHPAATATPPSHTKQKPSTHS